MKPDNILLKRFLLLARAIWQQKWLFLPLLTTLPFAFLWFRLFLRLSLSALLLPGALFLHEYLHMVFVPQDMPVRVISKNGMLGVDFDGTVSPLRNLLIALAPHLVLWSLTICLWPQDPLIALPFALSGLSLPLDLQSWYQRSFLHD